MKDWIRRLPWFVLLLVIVTGCAGGGGGGSSPSPSSPDRSIDDFIARYVKLTKEKDSQGLAAMYTDPAEWTDVTGTRSLTRAEIKDLFDATYSIVSTSTIHRRKTSRSRSAEARPSCSSHGCRTFTILCSASGSKPKAA